MISEYHLKKFKIPIKERTVLEWRKKWRYLQTDNKFKRAKKRLIIKELLPLKKWNLERIYTERLGYKYDPNNKKHQYRFEKRLKDWFANENFSEKSDIIKKIEEKYA